MNQSFKFDLKFEEQLIKILNDIKPKNILIVTGKKSFDKSGIKERFMPILSEYNTFRFSDFSSNTHIRDVEEGVKATLNFQPDLIIAIGGGSVIDMAKQINIFAKHKNILKIITDDQKDLGDKICPLVAIPTTAGTGSETTHFAVLYIDDKKYSVAHNNMMPDYSIIDSTLCHTMSDKLQATCGFDALSQAIESYWSIQSTDESRQYSSDAINLILNNFKDSINGNPYAMSNMSKAAYLSGKAINISKTTAAHAVSYPLTIHYKISHGHAVALTLGYFFEINSQYEQDLISDSRGHQYIQKMMNNLYKLFNKDTAKECKIFWYKLMDSIGLETNLTKLGILDLNDIKKILEDVDPIRIANNPIMITKDNIKEIFLNMLNKNK